MGATKRAILLAAVLVAPPLAQAQDTSFCLRDSTHPRCGMHWLVVLPGGAAVYPYPAAYPLAYPVAPAPAYGAPAYPAYPVGVAPAADAAAAGFIAGMFTMGAVFSQRSVPYGGVRMGAWPRR